ncbi:MAG: hypothetical protein IJT91_03975, partial [Clostridia bacterium]|nr:hypothetical protein [Clostridia bacterium]
DYRNEAYRTQIRRIITDFSYEIGIEDEAEINDAAEDAYDELRSEIAGIISIIGTENWNKVPSFAGLYRSANVWFVPIILTAASALAILLVNANRKTTAYYYMVFPMWFAALILFVPSVMLSIYNVPVRIRGSLIATSFPLVNVYIAGFISNFIQMVLTTLLIVFAVLTIFLLLSILSNANHHGSHYVKNHHHHSGSSDDNIDLVL